MQTAVEPNIEYSIQCNSVSVEYTLSTQNYSGFKDYILNHGKHGPSTQKFQALKGVSVSVPKGQSLALIGHNGCGKSTLLKVIAGVIQPQIGSVSVKGRIGPMIEIGAGFDFELSGEENIELSCMLMGLSRREIAERKQAIVDFAALGDFIRAPIKNYSSGMVARIGFACATAIDPDVLLVDEVLSVGDTNFALKCLQRIKLLRERGTTVVLVSHDMAAVRSFCDRAIVLAEGNQMFDGSVKDGIAFHLDLMHERYLDQLPASQREEAKRLYLLQKNERTDGEPSAAVSARLIQKGSDGEEIDVAKEFSIELEISFTDSKSVTDGLAFGIAFGDRGHIIAGFNNLDLNYPDPASIIRSHSKVVVRYNLSKGIPELAARNDASLFVGIHDKHISREIFLSSVLDFNIRNSLRGANRHNYIVDIAERVTTFDIQVMEEGKN